MEDLFSILALIAGIIFVITLIGWMVRFLKENFYLPFEDLPIIDIEDMMDVLMEETPIWLIATIVSGVFTVIFVICIFCCQ